MLSRITRGIDWINQKQGALSGLLILPLVIVVIYEVVMRYVFNRPTIWGFESTTFLYGIHYMFGLSVMELADGHVKVDVIVNRLPPKARAWIGIVSGIIIFVPVFTLIGLGAFKFTWFSCIQLEHNSTSWAPPIYPLKVLMSIGIVLLWLQGIGNILKKIIKLKGEAAAS